MDNGIIPLHIDDIECVCFLGDLIQIGADAVELLHHGIVVPGRCVLRHYTINEMTDVCSDGNLAALRFLLQILCFFFAEPNLDFYISVTLILSSFVLC